MNTKTLKWPEDWSVPSDDEERLLASTLLPHLKLLSPKVVELIVKDNAKHSERWSDSLLALGIQPDIYLWDGSPVTFPGIKRHAGQKEIHAFRNKLKLESNINSLKLDDNNYPKELWSFALRNRKTNKTNPPGHSLAHIIDHKDYNSRNGEELLGFSTSEKKNLLAGLYTSSVNTLWIPNVFLKPTDHSSKIRSLLIQLVDVHYSDICEPLPHGLKFNPEIAGNGWNLNDFPRPAIKGDVQHIQSFLAYRSDQINDLLNSGLKEKLSVDS